MLQTPTMNLNLMRTFVIVGQSRDIKTAAEKLKMDQSNVSRNIKSLEEIMNTKLIIRNHKSYIELTESGKVLFAYYEKAYNLLFLAEKTHLQNHSLDCAKITIGTSFNCDSELFISKIDVFKKKYPNIVIKTIHLSTRDLFDRLSQYYVDFILSEKIDNIKKSSEIKSIDLFEEQYCIAYSSNYYNLSLTDIKQLNSIPLLVPTTNKKVRILFDEQLESLGIAENVSIESDDENELKMYANLGLGFALLPKRVVKNSDLAYLDLDIHVTIAISYVGENLTPSNTEFLKIWK